MLLELLEKHWESVRRIGLDAEKRGRAIGVAPSVSDEGAQDIASVTEGNDAGPRTSQPRSTRNATGTS